MFVVNKSQVFSLDLVMTSIKAGNGSLMTCSPRSQDLLYRRDELMTIFPDFTATPTPLTFSADHPPFALVGGRFENWLAYFRHNRDRLRSLPWDCSYQLTDQERSTIATSIQAFQLGESSEGCHLMRLARQDAAHRDDLR